MLVVMTDLIANTNRTAGDRITRRRYLLERGELQVAIEGLGTLGLKENFPLSRVEIGGFVYQLAIYKILHVIMSPPPTPAGSILRAAFLLRRLGRESRLRSATVLPPKRRDFTYWWPAFLCFARGSVHP